MHLIVPLVYRLMPGPFVARCHPNSERLESGKGGYRSSFALGSRADSGVVISKSDPKALYGHTLWSGFAGPLRVARYSAAATCFSDCALAFASAWALALATAALAASLCSNISRCSSSASSTGVSARSM